MEERLVLGGLDEAFRGLVWLWEEQNGKCGKRGRLLYSAIIES
jgi:hypothetical protein